MMSVVLVPVASIQYFTVLDLDKCPTDEIQKLINVGGHMPSHSLFLLQWKSFPKLTHGLMVVYLNVSIRYLY